MDPIWVVHLQHLTVTPNESGEIIIDNPSLNHMSFATFLVGSWPLDPFEIIIKKFHFEEYTENQGSFL
jgi:hypothetical protein